MAFLCFDSHLASHRRFQTIRRDFGKTDTGRVWHWGGLMAAKQREVTALSIKRTPQLARVGQTSVRVSWFYWSQASAFASVCASLVLVG